MSLHNIKSQNVRKYDVLDQVLFYKPLNKKSGKTVYATINCESTRLLLNVCFSFIYHLFVALFMICNLSLAFMWCIVLISNGENYLYCLYLVIYNTYAYFIYIIITKTVMFSTYMKILCNCSIPNHQQALDISPLILCQACNAAILLVPTCIKDLFTEIQVGESVG